MAETDEQRFHDALLRVELDLRYLDFCRKQCAAVLRSPDDELDLAGVAAVVEKLPLSFKYVKSENFFRFWEKIDGAELFYQLRMRHSLVTPMINLETEEYAFGMPFAMLALRLIKTRDGYGVPEPRELALCFSTEANLLPALEFTTELYREAQAELKAAGPWGVRPGR